jgi:drug/metabolite transporter (DMT)-like permease
MTTRPVHQRRRGILLIVSGALLFAAMGAMAKGASRTIPTFELVGARSLVTWLAMEGLRRRMGLALRFSQPWALASRTIAGFVAIACYFHALRFIPLGEAVLLNNTSPVLTSVAAVWLLGERLTWLRVAALATALGGLWLLLGPRDLASVEGHGALLGIASAVAGSWAMISLKKASAGNRSVMIVWALAAVSTLGSLLVADRAWQWPDGREGALLIGTGLAAAGAQLLFTSGFRLVDASEAGVYGLLTPVFATLLGGLLFGEWPGGTALLGGVLIVAAGAGSAWLQARHDAQEGPAAAPQVMK